MAAGKAAAPSNSLITTKTPDVPLTVQLHPLVLLTISDQINRHILRQQQGPVLGAIIGQQNGRQFTLEHAFECRTASNAEAAIVDAEWFTDRLESYREVHKAPAQLDLVALFMLGSLDGPQEVHLPALKQVRELTGNDSILLLLFHGELIDQLQGGKLPITLFEAVQEGEGEKAELKFRELTFEVETGEAEMIGVDTVAKAGGTAMAVWKPDTAAQDKPEASKKETKGKGKGKAKDKEEEANGEAAASVLSPEDDELIASLTAKANAIKMLNQRLNLIRGYLETLPSSYLTDTASTTAPPPETNHILLRSINSMLSRVPLLSPPPPSHTEDQQSNGAGTTSARPPTSALEAAGAKKKQDVHLTSLLAALSRSVSEAQSMGSKFHVVSREKQSKDRSSNFGGGGFGGGANWGVRGGRGGVGMADDGFGEVTGGF